MIVSNASSTAHQRPAVGSLFDGLSFFLTRRTPTRSHLIADIEANGGSVVRIEKQADYIIDDHAKRDAAKGSYSYELITTAIKDGAMPDPEDHPAGPRAGTVREVASGIPAKGTRTQFTSEDDRELWQWVQKFIQRAGSIENAKVKGNEIYKLLEQQNPRHTHQAWRDRYVKKLMDRPPAGVELTVPANPPPSPPLAPDEQHMSDGIRTPPVKRRRIEESPEQVLEEVDDVEENDDLEEVDDLEEADGLEQDPRDQDDKDVERLLRDASDIETMDREKHDVAWTAYSQAFPHRSAGEWAQFYLERVRPTYKEQCTDRKLEERDPRKRKRRASSNDDHRPESAQLQSPLDHQFEDVDVAAVRSQPVGVTSHGDPVSMHHSTIKHSTNDEEYSETNVPNAATSELAQTSDIPTSDANQAANKQIQDEVTAVIEDEVVDQEVSEDDEVYQSALTTPRKDTTATSRIEHELAEWRKPQSPLAERDKTPNSASVSEDDYQDDDDSQHTDGTALTEANLAAQEAQHRPPVRRGIDLAEDDPANDQTELLEYLQSLNAGGLHTAPPNPPAASPDTSASQESEADKHNNNKTEVLEHISQDELDETIRQNMDWPSSPQQPSPVKGVVLTNKTVNEHSRSPWSAGKGKQSANHEIQPQAPPNSRKDASHSQLSAYNDDNEDLSDHDIDLSVAIPDNELGFGASSDRNSQLFMSEGSPEPQRYEDKNRYDRYQTAADVIEISSASPPSSPLDDAEHEEDALDIPDQTRAGRVLETQDIYGAETQQPDLFMPLPPDSDDDDVEEDDDDQYGNEHENENNDDDFLQPIQSIERQSSRKSKRTHSPTPPPDINSQEEAVQLESWMATMKVRGHDESLIIQALKCTSMSLDLAELVLMHIKGGKGIPDDVPGVWTHEEDEQVEGGNARALRRLEAKHGWPACAARLQFLEDYRDEN